MKRPKMEEDSSGFVSKSMEEMSRKRFHFFKIIQPYTIQHKRLGLPRKFIRKFGQELRENAVLTVPSGSKWDVKVVEADGEVWFQDGWQEFMEFHSICVGHFLIFGYDGDSCFHVVICDMGASEIDYPLPASSKEGFDDCNEDQVCRSSPLSEQSASIEILDAGPSITKRDDPKKKVMDDSQRQHSSDSIEILDVCPSIAKRADPMKKVMDDSQRQHSSKARCVEPPSSLLQQRSSLPKISLNTSDESDAGPSISKDEMKKIKEQLSDCGLTDSSESGGCGLPTNDESLSADVPMTTPKEEDVSQFSPSSDENASVEILDSFPPFGRRGDSMKKFTDEREHQHMSKTRRVESQSRRRRFSLRMIERSNNSTRTECDPYSGPSVGGRRSTKGDKRTKYATIVREEFSGRGVTRRTELDGYSSSSDEGSSSGAGEGAFDAANAFKSVNPFCRVVMRRSYVGTPFLLNMPFEFAKKNLLRGPPFVTLRVSDGRTWEVGYYHDNSCFKIKNGWKEFVYENHLVEGDVCVFELVNKHQLELKVHIYRAR